MYCIRWINNFYICEVVGDVKSILNMAHILEGTKNQYKISNVAGFNVSQDSMGCGGMEYWLKPDESFQRMK